MLMSRESSPKKPAMPKLRKVLFGVSMLIALAVVIFGSFLLYMTVTDYNPEPTISLAPENNTGSAVKLNSPFSILTFNIGYAGLDKNQDFFMDGGKMSRSSSKEQTETNLKNIGNFLGQENPDFILLQEIDRDALRSFHLDELADMKQRFASYSSTFGVNYKVAWVPVPLLDPMGSVYSGLATFSQFKTTAAARYQYPGREAWPQQMFDLDRAFIENRIPVENGKELVLINSHLSAFDKGGEIRKQQLAFLKQYIVKEFTKGNYVIVGGDWNHVIPGTDPKLFKTTQEWPFWLQNLPQDFTPQGFKWAADKNIPSVRTNGNPYVKDVNFRVVIDGFLVSPNVQIDKVSGHELNFENSDHNPVTGVFQLN